LKWRANSRAGGRAPLGLLSEAQWIEAHIALTTGDVCIFMTDGVTESFDPDASDVRAVVSRIVRAGTRSVSDICTAIMARAAASPRRERLDGRSHGGRDA